jgi:hypothetical protein
MRLWRFVDKRQDLATGHFVNVNHKIFLVDSDAVALCTYGMPFLFRVFFQVNDLLKNDDFFNDNGLLAGLGVLMARMFFILGHDLIS